jgi:hypothetical protein
VEGEGKGEGAVIKLIWVSLTHVDSILGDAGGLEVLSWPGFSNGLHDSQGRAMDSPRRYWWWL